MQKISEIKAPPLNQWSELEDKNYTLIKEYIRTYIDDKGKKVELSSDESPYFKILKIQKDDQQYYACKFPNLKMIKYLQEYQGQSLKNRLFAMKSGYRNNQT